MAWHPPVPPRHVGRLRALIAALRARLAQQQHVIDAYQARDARLAAVLRSLAYSGAGRGRSGGMPLGTKPFGTTSAGGPGGGRASSGWGEAVSPLAMLARTVYPGSSAAGGFPLRAGPWGHLLGR
jgi:hypothetical protein